MTKDEMVGWHRRLNGHEFEHTPEGGMLQSTEPSSHNYRAHSPHLLKPVCLEPTLHNKRSLCNKRRHGNKKPMHCN